MRILLTNDDGISSAGLQLLAEGLKALGHRVFVLAPDADRSGISHAVSFISGPCRMSKVGEDAWSCSGTPVDCVSLALMGVFPEFCSASPDLVISGINRGPNLGTDIVYSGTAAAARQASLLGIPAIALSLVEGEAWRWEAAVSFSIGRLEEIKGFWKANTFVNVNIPNSDEPPLGLVSAFPARRRYVDGIDLYTSPSGELYSFTQGGKTLSNDEEGSDCNAISGNYASMSAIFVQPLVLEEVAERKGKH
jgi:5'-nucleotidase